MDVMLQVKSPIDNGHLDDLAYIHTGSRAVGFYKNRRVDMAATCIHPHPRMWFPPTACLYHSCDINVHVTMTHNSPASATPSQRVTEEKQRL